MDKTITIDNGNSVTNVIEAKESSKYFWNYYYSPTYLQSKENFVFVSTLDLMGNPLKQKLNSRQKKTTT